MNYLKEKIIPLSLAILQWCITSAAKVDRLYFSYNGITKYYVIAKVGYLALLIIGWLFIFDVIHKLRQNDSFYKRGFFIFKAYFTFILFLLFVLWPGTWSWDDFLILVSIKDYSSFFPWQGVLSGIYYDILLQILPFPGGIILLQNVIIAICVAYSVAKLEKLFSAKMIANKYIDVLVKCLPFIMPPVILYQFSGYRMGLYIYLELVLVVMLIDLFHAKREVSWSKLLMLALIAILVSAWRSESLFYVPIVGVVILMTNKLIFPWRKKIICFLLILGGFWRITSFQAEELQDSNYQIMSLIAPATELVRAADSVEDASELAVIDRVLNVDVIINQPELDGASLYWSGTVVKSTYEKDDYNSFVKAIVKLTLKYPKPVLKERLHMFLIGVGVKKQSNNNDMLLDNAFDLNTSNSAAIRTFENGWFADRPIFYKVRKQLVRTLLFLRNDGTHFDILRIVINNTLLPMIILIITWFILLFKRKWNLVLICTAIVIRIPIIFLTEPSPFILYSLPFYLLGYVLILYVILAHLEKEKI